MQTTKYTEYTKPTGCKQTRGYTKSAAAVGGYETPSFVWVVYFVVSLFRRSGPECACNSSCAYTAATELPCGSGKRGTRRCLREDFPRSIRPGEATLKPVTSAIQV